MEGPEGRSMDTPIYPPGLGALLLLWIPTPRSALSTLPVLLVFFSQITGSFHVTLVTCHQARPSAAKTQIVTRAR
jgi:hypothetical protein